MQLRKTSLVRQIVRKGKRLSPIAEIATGVVLVAVPIPEPVLEITTDVAGAVLVADGVRRLRR